MNKSINKKALATVILISFFSGTIPVYASTLLSQNTLDYISSKIFNKVPDYYESLQSSGSDAAERNSEALKQYLDSSIDRVITDSNAFTAQEQERISKELDAYTEELQKEIDPVIDGQEEDLKKVITELADQQIKASKERLASELSEKLHEIYPDRTVEE